MPKNCEELKSINFFLFIDKIVMPILTVTLQQFVLHSSWAMEANISLEGERDCRMLEKWLLENGLAHHSGLKRPQNDKGSIE